MLVAALNPQTEPPALWTLVLGRSWMVYTGTQLHSVMFSGGKYSPPYFKFIGKFSNCILAIFFVEWKVTFHVAAAQLDSRGFCQQLLWTIKVYTAKSVCMTTNYHVQLNLWAYICILVWWSLCLQYKHTISIDMTKIRAAANDYSVFPFRIIDWSLNLLMCPICTRFNHALPLDFNKKPARCAVDGMNNSWHMQITQTVPMQHKVRTSDCLLLPTKHKDKQQTTE